MSDLNLNDLPSSPKEALLGLIGSTFAELKRVDEYSVSKNQFTTGIKTDINRLISEAERLEVSSQPQQQPQIYQQVPPQPVLHPEPVQQPVINPQSNIVPVVETQPLSNDDPDQLLLDFYRKITPEDINTRLADIDSKLYQILQILKKING